MALGLAGRPTWFRRGVQALLVLGAVLVVYVGATFVQVWQASRTDQAQDAGAIIVMGAAQYDGRPSPVLEGRLDHALELYEEGFSEIIVLTGGSQEGDRFNEAQAGSAYLRERGVPESALRLEVDGTNSWESLAASARFLADEGIDEVIVVSDPYHSKRLEEIASEVDIEAHVSPTDDDGLSAFGEFRAMVRETAAVSVGRIIGYRRLMRVDESVGG